MRELFGVFLGLSLALGAIGCQNDESDPPEIDVAALEQGLSAQELGCDSLVEGALVGSYRFEAKHGYHFHFTAKAQGWAFMQVRDENTGEFLFGDFGYGAVEATLIPEEHTAYRIFVWGRNYSLQLECEWPVQPHCVMWETADEFGNPSNQFSVEEVDSYEEGKQVLADFGHFINESIKEGTCAEVAAQTFCATVWAPVCGESFEERATWGNLCEYKRHLVEKAGENGRWKGTWEMGQCTDPHCVMWETVDGEGNPLQNFYAEEVDSYEEGKKVLSQVGGFLNEDIKEGTCAQVAFSMMCPMYCNPICTDTPNENTEYCNVCEFKRHVVEFAGKEGQWKGHWENGMCKEEMFCGGIAGIPCPEGYGCVLDGTYPDAGGHCEPYVCKYDGEEYLAGDSFPAGDGCNTCTCTEGGRVACTEIYCPKTCDPKEELWRDYVDTDPEMCTRILFACPETKEPFFNDCGCGCQPKKCNPEKEQGHHYVTHDTEQCAVIRFTCDVETQSYFYNDCGCGCEDRR